MYGRKRQTDKQNTCNVVWIMKKPRKIGNFSKSNSQLVAREAAQNSKNIFSWFNFQITMLFCGNSCKILSFSHLFLENLLINICIPRKRLSWLGAPFLLLFFRLLLEILLLYVREPWKFHRFWWKELYKIRS